MSCMNGGRITDMKVKGRKNPRITVYLDGQPWAELDAETVARVNLKRDQELNAEECQAIGAQDEAIRARKAAAGYQARQARTRREMRLYLERRGFTAAASEAAIGSLTESGTLDDRRAAQEIIQKKRRTQKSGPRRIEADLRAKGIEADAASRLVREALEEVDLASECLEAARRHAGRFRPLSDAQNRHKLSALLMRRGYDGEHIQQAIGRVCHDQQITAEEEPESI